MGTADDDCDHTPSLEPSETAAHEPQAAGLALPKADEGRASPQADERRAAAESDELLEALNLDADEIELLIGTGC